MSCQSQAWFLRFASRAKGEEVGGRACWQPPPCFPPPPLEDCRRPILIKLIKPAPFKELQPHATRGEKENIKLKRKKRNLPASTLLQSYPFPADP